MMVLVNGSRSSRGGGCRSSGTVATALVLQLVLVALMSSWVPSSNALKVASSSSGSHSVLRVTSTARGVSAALLRIPRGGSSTTSTSTSSRGSTTNTRAPAPARRVTPAAIQNKQSSNTSSTASPSSLIFNLVKAILGVGVLSLPAGIANFGNAPSALIPALTLIAVLGALSGYGFAVIGKVCHFTGASSYRDAWTASVGPRTSWIPAASITGKTFGACLAISMVLADTITGLLRLAPDAERTRVLLTLTVTVLLPLCWLKNLSALAPFSLAGICGMLYTAVAMTVRYLDGSYALNVMTPLRDQVPVHWQPMFGAKGAVSALTNPRALILVCMLSTAYMAHFIAPKVYQELKQSPPSSQAQPRQPFRNINNKNIVTLVNAADLSRFNSVVAISFGICIALFAYITAIGFLTFGGHSAGLILNNYASTDAWMSVSKVAVAGSLIFSYPLVFTGCRDGVLDLIGVSAERKSQDRVLNVTTILLLTVVTLLATALKDVSFVLALAGGMCIVLDNIVLHCIVECCIVSCSHTSCCGCTCHLLNIKSIATLGNALTYIYPALMYNAIVKKQNKQDEHLGLLVSKVAAVLGVVMGVIGTKLALDK